MPTLPELWVPAASLSWGTLARTTDLGGLRGQTSPAAPRKEHLTASELAGPGLMLPDNAQRGHSTTETRRHMNQGCSALLSFLVLVQISKAELSAVQHLLHRSPTTPGFPTGFWPQSLSSQHPAPDCQDEGRAVPRPRNLCGGSCRQKERAQQCLCCSWVLLAWPG